jgi:radical SAM protein with 4Fe4S-binding SPASM domain
LSVEGPQIDLQVLAENPYAAILRQASSAHRLFSVHWELTYRCNEKCSHCYLDVFPPQAAQPGELNTQECLGVIDQIAAAGALNLTLSGGEILVRQDFFEIAAYARSKRLLLRLFTNGILIHPKVADRIAALHPYAVEISLYSARPAVHDSLTQVPRSWELSTRALRLLHERGVRTVVKTPVMVENVRQIDELAALTDELGATFRYDITVTPKNSGALDPLRHRVSYADLVDFMRLKIDREPWLKRNAAPDRPTCSIAQKALQIDPYGNVLPCMEARFTLGNLREKSLSELWRDPPLWSELGGLTLNELPVCRSCELRHLCVRCHGLAWQETGDLHNPALANCREALARRQALVELGGLAPDYPIPAHLVQALETWIKQEEDGLIPENHDLPSPEMLTGRYNQFVRVGEHY